MSKELHARLWDSDVDVGHGRRAAGRWTSADRPGRWGQWAGVVAWEKRTGKEIWRSLDQGDPGYSAPIIIDAGNVRQLIVWNPVDLHGLAPETGAPLIEPTGRAGRREVVWSHPAFAGRCVFARNDREIVCVDLAADR